MLRTKKLMVIVLALSLLSIQAKCDKDTAVKWGERGVAAMKKAVPILEGAGVSTTNLREGINVGDRLVAALKSSDSTSAFNLTSALINVLEGIVADTNRISNPATRTLALAILATVDLALHEIIDALSEDSVVTPTMRGMPAVRRVIAYQQKKRWACRNSTTGRFERMEFCRANPALSTVDTF